MWRRPLLEIRKGGSTANILPGLDGLWLEATVTDVAGQESDTASLVCVGPPGLFALPSRGDEYEVLMGWADEGGPVLQGRYSYQRATASGDPKGGETITLEFRAADFVDKLKAHGRRNYDESTFGDIFKREAKDVGLEAALDGELAAKKVGYRLRWDQSPIDFLNELAEEFGATVKPAGGKLVALKRGSGKSAGGQVLEPILIHKTKGYGYDINIEPRPEVGKVAAAWHDEKSGRRKHVKHETGRDGPSLILPHPYRSEEDAKAAAEAQGYEQGHNTGSGSFDSPGLPHARAEAKVIATGFGPWIDGKWKAETVEKTVTSKGGFATTVSVKAGDNEKGTDGGGGG